MTYNASDRKDIRKAERLAELAEANRLAFLRAAMTTVEGRTFFYDLLVRCHLFSEAPSYEPFRDYFKAGERNIGLQLFVDLTTHCADAYMVMMREANSKEPREPSNVRRDRNSGPGPDSGNPASPELPGSPGSGWDPAVESVSDDGGWGAGCGAVDN